MFWHEDFWIITLIILLVVYILGKSKHLINIWIWKHLQVTAVSDVTRTAEMLGGRVKTLHPNIHGAILARPDPAHLGELKDLDITPIDVRLL